MDQDSLKLVIGIFSFLIIINTTIVYSTVISDPGNSTVNISAGKGNPVNVTANTVKPNVTTTTVAQTRKPTTAPTPTPKTYVQIVTPEPEVVETHAQIAPALLLRSEAGYDTLYSINNQSITERMPHIIIDVVNPPLLVDYVFTPVGVTDIKPLDYKIIKTQYHENRSMERPYENSWFILNVTDQDTGALLNQEGVGRYYGMQYEKQIVVPNSGKIGFDLDGKYGNITLTIKMRKPK